MIKNNNLKNISKEMQRSNYKFGIRRFSVGTASVLLGIGFISAFGTSNVHAAETDSSLDPVITDVTKTDPVSEEDIPTTPISEPDNAEVYSLVTSSTNEDTPTSEVTSTRNARAVVIDGSIKGSGENALVGPTDVTKPDVKHGISIGSKNDVPTLNGDKAFIDMAQNENGEFYLHFAYKNDSSQTVEIIDTIWLPRYSNTNPDTTIFPVINLDPASLGALTLGLDGERVTYSVPDKEYVTGDKVALEDISAIRNMQITGKLQPGQEAHLYIPYKIENFENLAKNGINSLANVSFGVNDSLLYNAGTKEDGTVIGFTNLAPDYHFNGVATRSASANNEALQAIFDGKADWQPVFVNDLGNGKYEYVNVEDLTGIKLSREDVEFNNGDVINDNSKLYLGGTYKVKNLKKIFDQISNKGYAIMVQDNNGNPGIYNEVTYSTGSNSAINDGDYTAGSVYVIVQKVFDTKDKVVTDVDGTWSPEMNLNTKPQLQTTQISPFFSVKTTDLSSEYTYEVKDAKGNVVADTNKLKPGLYTVTYKYKLADGNVVSSSSTISVPIPWTDLEPSQPITPPTPPTDNSDGDNNGDNESEENDSSSPDSQEKPENETDSDKLPDNGSGNNSSGSQSGNNSNTTGNGQNQNVGNSNSSKQNSEKLPQTNEKNSIVLSVLGLVAVIFAAILGFLSFKKKKEN